MTKKILYVEDEPDIQTIAQIALETVGGFTVKVCSSGEEALQEVDGFAPDIILLDVMMPGMDGLETFQKLRQRPRHASLPVVFMTARVQADEIQHYRDQGAVDVIAKPFDAMTLSNQVQTIFNALQESNSGKQLRLKQQLGVLRETYKHELLAKIAAIKNEWLLLKSQPSELLAHHLIRKVHSLSGSGATFELPAVSNAAQKLEAVLRTVDSMTGQSQSDDGQALDFLVETLEKAGLDAVYEKAGALPLLDSPQQINQMGQRVVVVCDNRAEAGNLREQLARISHEYWKAPVRSCRR